MNGSGEELRRGHYGLNAEMFSSAWQTSGGSFGSFSGKVCPPPHPRPPRSTLGAIVFVTSALRRFDLICPPATRSEQVIQRLGSLWIRCQHDPEGRFSGRRWSSPSSSGPFAWWSHSFEVMQADLFTTRRTRGSTVGFFRVREMTGFC